MPNIKSGHLTTIDYRAALYAVIERLERLGVPGPDHEQRLAFGEELGRIKGHLSGLVALDPSHAQATLRALLGGAAYPTAAAADAQLDRQERGNP